MNVKHEALHSDKLFYCFVDFGKTETGEQLARPMAHQFGLVVDRAHRHEPLAGAP